MRKKLISETKKETFARAGEGAALGLITKGADLSNVTGKTKATITRMKKNGDVKVSKTGKGKLTAKGKKKFK